MPRWHVCTGWFLRKSLSLQHVAKKNQTEFVRLVAATKFCCRENFSPKYLLYTRSHLSIRCVAATCCCNYSPDLHTKSDLSPRLVAATHRLVCFDLYALLGPVYIEVGDPQVGEVIRLGGVTRQSIQSLVLMWSRLHVRWGNPPHVTSLTWGTPPSCKQAFSDQGSWNFLFLVCKHVSGRPYCWQYNKQFFEEFTWKQFFIPRCPPWRHVQTSNTILKVTWNHCFTRR